MILAIVGPTGVGKTKLSIALAKLYNGEIINADSMQIYQGLDIGTAKITQAEMEHIPHHLLSIKEVSEDYSVFDYQKDARICIADIQSRGHIPIFVGGTGYYLKATLYDYQFTEDHENEIKELELLTDEELRQQIASYEVPFAIDFQNRRRMIRLLSRLKKDGVDFYQDFQLIYDDVLFIGLTTDRAILYQKIDQRFDKMLVPLIDEVKPFILSGVASKALKTGIGYKEFYDFFQNRKTLQEVVLECKKNSRNYAKRQYTWFENQLPVKWFSVDYDDFSKTVMEVVHYISTQFGVDESLKKR